MSEGVRNFLVGLTTIIALIALAGLLFSFGELDRFLNPRYRVTLLTDDAAGLRPGGGVEFNGVPVGVVHEVEAQADPKFPVRIVALIDNDVNIPANVEPFAATPLIGGSARLQLQAHNGAGGAGHLPKDGTAVLEGPIRSGLFEQVATQLDERMKPVLDAFDSFNRLSQTYITLGENLNLLLLPQTPEQIQSGEQPNLRTTVTRLNLMLEDASEALALGKQWLGDERMRDDAHAAIHNSVKLIDDAAKAVERYTKLADSIDENARALTHRLLPLADELAATLNDVRRLARAAGDGRGTIAQLLNNPDLYNSLTDAAIRLERTLIEAQLLIQQLQAEGVRFTF